MPNCPHCGADLPAGATICPRCGRGVSVYAMPPPPAAYGAPPPAAAPAGKGGKVALFVILGAGCAIFAVAILGIGAAIVIPNFLDATQKAKQKRTMAEMRSAETAIMSYYGDKESYPEGTASELAPLLAPYGYSGKLVDGWEHPLRYTCLAGAESEPSAEGEASPAEKKCGSFELASPGRDGKFENEPGQYAQGTFEPTAYDDDIVVRDGNFLRWPQKATGGD